MVGGRDFHPLLCTPVHGRLIPFLLEDALNSLRRQALFVWLPQSSRLRADKVQSHRELYNLKIGTLRVEARGKRFSGMQVVDNCP